MDDKELLTKSDSFTPMMTRKRSTLTFDFGLPSIPVPPRPPEPTSVSVGSLIPKRPIPPDVPRPPIVNLYGDELSDDAAYEDKPSWYLVWLFGLFIGISIGLLIAKSL